MRTRWEGVHAALVDSVKTLQAEREFQGLRTKEPVLSKFDIPNSLVSYLTRPSGDLDEKDRIYAALVRVIQGQSALSDLAAAVTWLGLWPGLDAIYQRISRHYRRDPDALSSDLAASFTAVVARADLSRINRVAATLIWNTERDLLKGLRGNWERDSRERLVDRDVLEGMAQPEPPRCDVDGLRSRLEPIVGADADLLAGVLGLGETQREAAERLGIGYEAARKRFARAMVRVRSHFLLGPVPLPLGEVRFRCRGPKRPERGHHHAPADRTDLSN